MVGEIEKCGKRVHTFLNTRLSSLMLNVRNDRDASLEYLKRAAADRRWVASGRAKQYFEAEVAFEAVRNDEAFLAVVNGPMISE